MYEDNEQPALRRVLLAVVWLVIIATIAWAFIWLAFFRHNNHANQGGSLKSVTSQHTQPSPKSSTGKNNPQGSSGTSNSSTGQVSSGSSSSTGSTSPQQPQALANTGAGNVFIPFGAASVIGTVAYYVRLRRKLTQ